MFKHKEQDAAPAKNDKGSPTEDSSIQKPASQDTGLQAETDQSSPASPQLRNKYADKMNKKHRKMNKKIKVFISIVLVAGVVAGSVILVQNVLKSQQEQQQQQKGGGSTFSMRGRLETFVSGWGSVVPKDKSELGKSTKGKVLEVNVKTGDVITAGDILFKVDPSDAQKELDTALNELDGAQTAVSDAQKSIAHLNIRAPFSGKIVKLEELKEGQQLGNGSAFATIADDSYMKLSLYFSYAYIDEMKEGMDAVVSIPASMATVEGKVDSIEKVKKISADGTMLFKATISMKNPGTLSKDMLATATVGTIVPAESGKLEYNHEEDIQCKTSGEIKEIIASEFYEYKEGDILCRLENDSLDSTLKNAQRSLETAQNRVEDLQKTIAEAIVSSPIDGIVTALMVSVGDELSGSGTSVATVSNLSTMMVEINIDELDISKVSVGMPVIVSVDQADGTKEISGELVDLSFEAKGTENNGGMGGGASYFPAKIQIDNANRELMPGMGVNYKISANVREDCIYVPTAAIVYAGEDTAAVYAKPAEGVTFDETLPIPEGSDVPEGYVMVPVVPGISDGSNSEIVSGLPENVEVFLAAPVDPWASQGGSVMIG